MSDPLFSVVSALGVSGLGFRVWGLGFLFGVWGLGFGVWGLGFGVWGLGFGGLRCGKIGLNTFTLMLPNLVWPKSVKNIKHKLWPKLAKVGWAKVGQAHCWPKLVKELAKVGLAKVGHDQRGA